MAVTPHLRTESSHTDAGNDLRPVADHLLTSMAALRRTLRRSAAGRPRSLAGITSSQLELVTLLRREPGVSVAEAADRLRLAPNTVSTLVRQLVDAGLVVRGTDPTDGRVVRLELEPETRQRMIEWRDRRTELLARTIGDLPETDQDVLAEATRILARLTSELESAGDPAPAQATTTARPAGDKTPAQATRPTTNDSAAQNDAAATNTQRSGNRGN